MKADGKSGGALEGVKVLDLSRYIAGPYCGMILADMGADVAKVEKPGTGDITRSYVPGIEGASFYSMVVNRNKRSIAIDVRNPEGQDLIRRLAAEADVVLENFRPGTLERMGCGWDVLSEINPRLILARVSGFGQDGPYSSEPCFDVIAQAMSGLMDLTGFPDGPPTLSGTYIIDFTSALYTCIGILGALAARNRTGRGQVVDVAMLDSAVSFLLTSIPEKLLLNRDSTRRGNSDRFGAPNNTYKTQSGDWIHVAAGSLFPRFADAVGRPELKNDARYSTVASRLENRNELDAIAAEWVASQSTTQALETLKKCEVPVAKVATIADVVRNPQLIHRGQISEARTESGKTVPMQGVTIHMSETPLSIRYPQGSVGQHTDEILKDWLGFEGLG